MSSLNLFLLIFFLIFLGCVSTPKTVYRPITVPAAYLHLDVLPDVPSQPVSNYALLDYLFSLHDYSVFCRQQISQIKTWSEMSEND